MEIEEAIQRTRKEAGGLRKYAEYCRVMGDDMIAAHKECDAFAMETVCDKLEAFLRRQEEDNSYHSR